MHMTLNLLKYGKNLLSTTHPFTTQSIEAALNQLDICCGTTDAGQKIPNKLQIPMVIAADPHNLHLPTYDSAYELLTDLPGKLVLLNRINIPRKLQHHNIDTIYDTTQVYRTLSGEWKLVCRPYNARYKGTYAVPLSSLILVQEALPQTAPGFIRITYPAPLTL